MAIKWEPAKDLDHPDFIKTVRMYRNERGLSFQEAKDTAIREFEKRGWLHPFQK